MRPAIASGIVTVDAPVSYWSIFPLSLVRVPQVFAEVNSTQFPNRSLVANELLYLAAKQLAFLKNIAPMWACI